MSHDQDAGGLTASHTPRTRKPGTQAHAGRLERPSLFAGMEDDDVDDIEADRVRLLSTLASRGRSQARSGRWDAGRAGRTPGRERPGSGLTLWASPWWGRALFTAMALGACVVLYSFVQVVRQPHAMSAQARAAVHAPGASGASGASAATSPAQAAVTASGDLDALPPTAAGADIAPPHATSAEASDAASFQDVAATASARIEVVPPMATAPLVPTATPAQPPAVTADPSHKAVQAAQADRQAQQAQSALVARAAADAARLNAPPSASAQPPARPAAVREAGARTRASEDVALLEAMMKHASARRAPPSSVEALQACAALQGADAAVCKAKACVQHPTAPQCHGDTP